jgi:regulatory protein
VATARPRKSDQERREEKAAVDDPEVALAAALRFLEARSRSVAEVRTRLTRAGYQLELVESAIARLVDLGMLDDAAFAAQWVESRDRAHPRGEAALMVELRQKGIDAPTIAAILKARREVAVRWEDGPPADEAGSPSAAPPETADEAAARKLLARNARALGRVVDPRERRQKAYALLARNGFAPDVCREASIAFVRPPEDDGAAD